MIFEKKGAINRAQMGVTFAEPLKSGAENCRSDRLFCRKVANIN
jgi:hypothetical protein